MKNRLMFPLMFVAAVGVACGGDGARRGAQQQSYETVQEGSAAGVTSTIQGPGEALPPVTGTNADTTSAFSIDPNAVGTAPPPIAAPPPMYPPPQMSSSPAPAPPRPVTRPPEPKPEPAPEPAPPTETAEPTETAPPTETAAPPTQTDTNEEPAPPPPTTTDTRGQ